MRRAGRKKKPLTIQPIKCVVMLSSDEENDCIAGVLFSHLPAHIGITDKPHLRLRRIKLN